MTEYKRVFESGCLKNLVAQARAFGYFWRSDERATLRLLSVLHVLLGIRVVS